MTGGQANSACDPSTIARFHSGIDDDSTEKSAQDAIDSIVSGGGSSRFPPQSCTTVRGAVLIQRMIRVTSRTAQPSLE